MKNIIVDYAFKEVEEFVNWVKQTNQNLAESILGDDTFYQTTDVEKLFETLDENQKNDYQYIVDNKHNVETTNKLGLLEASGSIPSGEVGYKLKYSLKVLADASIENMPNTLFIPSKLEIETVGEETSIFATGGTNMMEILNKTMKEQAINNIDKVRHVMYFTDADPIKDSKTKP